MLNVFSTWQRGFNIEENQQQSFLIALRRGTSTRPPSGRVSTGHYFMVMPFGVTNAPATFQRMMNKKTLDDFLSKFVMVYLDDILISRNEEEQDEHIRATLQKLRQKKLYAKRSKCDLGMTELDYLGHVLGADGIKMENGKVDALQKWPTPTGVKEVCSFLGLVGYYRRFIEYYAQRTHTLTELLKEKSVDVEREPAEEVHDIKQAVTTAPVLAIPDPSLPYEVYTDSSAFALGAIPLHDHGRGLQPCAYLSHELSGAEQNYKVHEQELLGIIHALKTWKPCLEGVQGELRPPIPSEVGYAAKLSQRQARWVESLQAYDCAVHYVSGEGTLLLLSTGDQTYSATCHHLAPQALLR